MEEGGRPESKHGAEETREDSKVDEHHRQVEALILSFALEKVEESRKESFIKYARGELLGLKGTVEVRSPYSLSVQVERVNKAHHESLSWNNRRRKRRRDEAFFRSLGSEDSPAP